MIEKLKKLFTDNRDPSAVEVRALIAEAEASRARAVADLATMRDQRAEALLVADEKTLRALEADIRGKELEAERLAAALAKLTEKLGEAEDRERESALRAKVAAAQAASDRGVKLLTEAAPLCARLAEIFGEVSALEVIVRESGAAARELGLDAVEGPNQRFRGRDGRMFRDAEGEARIPDLERGMGLAWPPDSVDGRQKINDRVAKLRAA